MTASQRPGERVTIIIDAPRPSRPRLCPPHIWAWAYLNRGGTVQVCRVCGTER